jgi:hypothetical protein
MLGILEDERFNMDLGSTRKTVLCVFLARNPMDALVFPMAVVTIIVIVAINLYNVSLRSEIVTKVHTPKLMFGFRTSLLI